ncbi:hypothetical protein VNI00_018082 [Paramarasmius palmivorus]|uniref:Alpha/beta hydrolase fold-3 domain-containing protein n=1 Tax=Paramarasmius palmivorus TaxID=297713 RepID=A0AAW0B1E8_9AGAR
MAEHTNLSTIDPELAPLVANSPPYTKSTPQEQRDGYKQFGLPIIKKNLEQFLPPADEYKASDRFIRVDDGVEVLAKCVTPVPKDGEDGKFPLIFWIHGGGWFLGEAEMDDYTLRATSVKHRVSVVNCEYRLAPENPFPTGVNDVLTALKYVVTHPAEFSADVKKGLIVGGTSAGGNLAAVLSHLTRDDPFFEETPVTGQILQIPSLCHPKAYPEKYKSLFLSMEQNKDAPALPAERVHEIFEWYGAPPEDPRMSPLLLASHKGLPPAFIQVCGFDPLRDDGIVYEKVLKEAGVPTKLEIYPGTTHGFHAFYVSIKQAVKWREDYDAGIAWLLN